MLKRARAIALAVSGSAAPAVSTGKAAFMAAWTFPLMMLSAFVIAWGAEVAQFFMSQGVALAILAWLQILPEFAVEADIAWRQNVVNMTANFTGSIRLLVGLGWPMIYATAALVHHRRTGVWLKEVTLERDHSVSVVGLLVPTLYFLVIWAKASLAVYDAVVLIVMYFVYLWLLNRVPPKDQDHENAEELDYVPRKVLALRPGLRGAVIVLMFLLGGGLLLAVTHPFVDSLMALALTLGMSEYVFIQWVAPLLSEFPEFLSAFRWAKKVTEAPMALMNVVSSNINQWTVLAGMIPIVYSVSLGHVASVPFDGMHSHEVLLTVLQSLVGMVFLVNMRFAWWEAIVMFVLWFVQFLVPALRVPMIYVYTGFVVVGIARIVAGGHNAAAFTEFAAFWRTARRS